MSRPTNAEIKAMYEGVEAKVREALALLDTMAGARTVQDIKASLESDANALKALADAIVI